MFGAATLVLLPLLCLSSVLAIPMQESASSTFSLPKFPSLYEISTRPWLYSLSQKYGRSITSLSDIPDEELDEIAQQNFNVVWFMGIWQLGAYGLQHDRTDPNLMRSYSSVLPGWTSDDVIGSPYAIVSYEVNPELGTAADLKSLRQKLNARGMGLCVDFVPNHAAVDTPFAISNPDWFVRQPAGESFDPSMYVKVGDIALAFGHDIYSGAWTDTLQWNYWNPSLRSHLVSTLSSIAGMADMVRVDMAMNELNPIYQKAWGSILTKNGYSAPSEEFWSVAISAALSVNPNFRLMAEAYVYGITSEPEDLVLQKLGFHFTYDKNLLDDLHNGQNIGDYIRGRGVNYFSKAANFLSNHDEPRAIPTLGGVPQSKAAAALVYTLPGLRFFWMGQREGFTAKLDVHLRRETAESAKQDVSSYYDKLMSIIKSPAFQGRWEMVEFHSGSNLLLGWRWEETGGKAKRFVVVNYSPYDNQYGEGVLPNAASKGGDTLNITELLSDTVYPRYVSEMKSSGLKVLLNAWQAQIFDYSEN